MNYNNKTPYGVYDGNWVNVQDQRKLFITGQAKLNPEHYSCNVWAADNFITAFYQLYYNIINLSNLKTTLPLCLLLSFLHNRIPCKYV